jgi:hypothetical protein
MWKRIVRGIALSFALVLTVFIGILAGLANSAAAGAPGTHLSEIVTE